MQSKVLALLDNLGVHAFVTVSELAAAMTPTGDEVAASLIESVRRAVKCLAADGVIETEMISVSRDWAGGSRPTVRRMLAARMEGRR